MVANRLTPLLSRASPHNPSNNPNQTLKNFSDTLREHRVLRASISFSSRFRRWLTATQNPRPKTQNLPDPSVPTATSVRAIPLPALKPLLNSIPFAFLQGHIAKQIPRGSATLPRRHAATPLRRYAATPLRRR
jgi:hypothetical protein